MRRALFLFCCLLLSVTGLQAQKLTVDRFEVAVGDLSASVNQRNDLNGEACALVRVMLKDSGPLFEGNVLGDVTKKGLQYNVYMSAGSRHLRIVPTEFFPIMVTFSDYGIKSLEGKVTYDLVLVSEGATPQDTTIQSNVETITVNGVSFNMIRVEGQGAPFYIGETEVTQALWEAVMGKNPSYFKGSNRPVECVCLVDCLKFLKKLNKKTKRKFRLPKDTEWEYAAKGGQKTHDYEYSGSNNIDEVAWYSTNASDVGSSSSEYGTHAVMTKKPNELGIYDMSGNVWEWYGSLLSNRMYHGGSWNSNAGSCRVSNRSKLAPAFRSYNLGLRLAL